MKLTANKFRSSQTNLISSHTQSVFHDIHVYRTVLRKRTAEHIRYNKILYYITWILISLEGTKLELCPQKNCIINITFRQDLESVILKS